MNREASDQYRNETYSAKVNRRSLWVVKPLILTALLALPAMGLAKVSSAEAQRLHNDLTPVGAERGASASGNVPAWNGGITEPPADYRGPGTFHPPMFADEKPLAVITSQNAPASASLLSDGQKALLNKYSTYQINLFTSHRTHSAPQWLYDNTFINATNTVLTDDGAGIEHAFGGVPFPIPGSGLEVIWNHLTRWRGLLLKRDDAEAVVFPDGNKRIVLSFQEIAFNYYKPRTVANDFDNVLFYYISFVKSPPQLAGGALLLIDTLNQRDRPRQSWGYNAGQRRVRRLPNISYDSPALLAESVRTADDTDMFNGSPDRYDWKLLGKKELIVPYNCYAVGMPELSYDTIFTPFHLNPDFVRSEIHRVWVVEGTLKSDASHIYEKRVFYIDEDSWGILMTENYDKQGNLWRVGLSHTRNVYEAKGVMPFADVIHDLKTDQYNAKGFQNHAESPGIFENEIPSADNYTPAALRTKSHR